MRAIPTIDELSSEAEFVDVSGIPVATDDLEAFAYDTNPPRWFPMTGVMNDGVEITKDEFMRLVNQFSGA